MGAPFVSQVAETVPMDSDKLLTIATQENLQQYLGAVCAPDTSQKPTYLANGEVNYIEFFKGPTQTAPNRIYRVEMTYDVDLNPTQEVWKIYSVDSENKPVNGTTIFRTVTFTHTWSGVDYVKTTTVVA